MVVLDRLKLELSNQQYFSDEQYAQFLAENDLSSTDEYVKADMQKNLLYAVIDILEAVANDIDTMRSISTEFSNISEAYQYIETRIDNVRDKILEIPDPSDDASVFSLMFSKEEVRTRPYVSSTRTIPNADIDAMIRG